VLEITGEYSGSCGSIGPTHERGDQAYDDDNQKKQKHENI
jgi:hypothetical protein